MRLTMKRKMFQVREPVLRSLSMKRLVSTLVLHRFTSRWRIFCMMSLVLAQKDHPRRRVYPSATFTSKIDGSDEMDEAVHGSRTSSAPPSPVISAFIEDVSTSPSSIADSSPPPISLNKHQRQLSVETNKPVSERCSVDISSSSKHAAAQKFDPKK